MPQSPTPLSDCISRYVDQGTSENYAKFIEVFLCSNLGVIVTGVPPGNVGQYVASKNELAVAMSNTPDGKKMVLACADRAVFVRRFSKLFNAEVGAPALLKIAWSNPECEGIMLNSAASEHRILIVRKEISELIAASTGSPPLTL